MRDPSEGEEGCGGSGHSPIFWVGNKHMQSCGKPPQIRGDVEGHYHGYFENEYGEQAIFVYDSKTRTATLWMGDAGWEESREVIDGQVLDLILAPSEVLWLEACWKAATSGRGS